MTNPELPRAPADDREARIQALLDRLRPQAEAPLRRMAEALVDAPAHQLFGAVEFALRDAAHDLAATAHQAGLDGRKKRATRGPASPAATAATTPATSPTAPTTS